MTRKGQDIDDLKAHLAQDIDDPVIVFVVYDTLRYI